MLLIRKAPWVIVTAVLGLTLSTSAKTDNFSSALEIGTYQLLSGDKELCGKKVEISKNDLKGKTLFIGSLYSYELKNSQYQIESDIDPECEFKETNTREDVGNNRVVLIRINKELCKGNMRSTITSTATLTPGEIEVRHEIDSAEPYTCRWQKKK